MMHSRLRFPLVTALLGVGLLLLGCERSSSNQGESYSHVSAPVKGSSSQPTTPIGSESNAAPGIVAYGPHDVQAGVVFNKQPNGDSAVWVHMSQSLEGTDAVIKIDGAPMKSSIDGNAITALVPASLYKAPAALQLSVEQHKGGRLLRSGPVPVNVH